MSSMMFRLWSEVELTSGQARDSHLALGTVPCCIASWVAWVGGCVGGCNLRVDSVGTYLIAQN